MRMRISIALALTAIAVIAFADTAGARTYGSANFTARISGTYETSGTVTNTRCFRVDDQDNVTYFTSSGAASEKTAFQATRGSLLGVSRTRGDRRIFAGGPTIPVRATVSRTSDLSAGSEPANCRPNTPPPSCGTKTGNYKLEVYGVGHGFGFSYNPSNGFSTTFPDDPFQDCPLVEGDSWWGASYSRGNGRAAVSVARLLNPRVKTIVVHGKLDKAPVSSTSSYSAKATETLRWTLTLKRRR